MYTRHRTPRTRGFGVAILHTVAARLLIVVVAAAAVHGLRASCLLPLAFVPAAKLELALCHARPCPPLVACAPPAYNGLSSRADGKQLYCRL
jgi:hypothetical protein